MTEAKPFNISMRVVEEAHRRILSNGGTYGVDRESLEEFGKNLENNLYKIWNRMSSGSYMPPAVRRVDIPKKGAGTRPLGIPTVADRIAQMVVKISFEPMCEVMFHENSFGYRPGKSAHSAVELARERCWEYSWVIDLDIKSFFDSIDHKLLMKAVKRRTQETWIHLYVARWLEAPVQHEDKAMEERSVGTPQGSVISPLLANLFLHYAFDDWMRRHVPYCPFERYADDIIVHCKTLMQANYVRKLIEERLTECKLVLHPEKTKIVYCKYGKSKRMGGGHKEISFDFLGFTFKPRSQKLLNERLKSFWLFTPAVSRKSKKAMMDTVRTWGLGGRTGTTLNDLAEKINPVVRGWINYYGKFRKSELYGIFQMIDLHLAKWMKKKYRIFSASKWKALKRIRNLSQNKPELFEHWRLRVVDTVEQ